MQITLQFMCVCFFATFEYLKVNFRNKTKIINANEFANKTTFEIHVVLRKRSEFCLRFYKFCFGVGYANICEINEGFSLNYALKKTIFEILIKALEENFI